MINLFEVSPVNYLFTMTEKLFFVELYPPESALTFVCMIVGATAMFCWQLFIGMFVCLKAFALWSKIFKIIVCASAVINTYK